MELKYITKSALNQFIITMDEIQTDQMVNDLNISDLLHGSEPKDLSKDINIFELAESFLYLFQEREDYELCQLLVNNWPQLKNQK
jgi:predicted TPR repeat methyltransferase